MATLTGNTFFPKGREAFAKGQVDWTSATIKAVLINTTSSDGAGNYYTPDDSHQYLSSVTAGARIGTATALSTKTATLGILDADDLTFSSVTSSYTADAIVIYKEDGGGESSSPLLMLISTATGLPVTPTGGNIVVQWDNGTNKIAKL